MYLKYFFFADKLADVIGLGKFFVQQIKLASSDSQKSVFLECLLAVLKTLKSTHVIRSEMFANYVRYLLLLSRLSCEIT